MPAQGRPAVPSHLALQPTTVDYSELRTDAGLSRSLVTRAPVFQQHVASEVAAELSPDHVDVIGARVGVVELDQDAVGS